MRWRSVLARQHSKSASAFQGREVILPTNNFPGVISAVLYEGGVPVLADDARRFRKILETEFQIENGTVYDPPCHLQPVFRGRLGLEPGTLPKAERALSQQLCPPIHSALSAEEVKRTIAAMTAVADRCRTEGA